MASPSLSETGSLHLIQSDLRFSRAVIKGIVAKQDTDETIPWLALSHLQYLSLVAYEVHAFLSKTTQPPAISESSAHASLLAASRHSTKLFNDTKKTQLELLVEFVNAAARDQAWFLQNNRAPRIVRAVSMLRALVDDTSVLLYDRQMLCTSHSIGFHARLDPRAKPAQTMDRSRELATYLSGLWDLSGKWTNDDYARGWRADLVKPKDAQYERLYPAMFPGVPIPQAIALAILQTDLTGLKVMRQIVPICDPLAPSTFKFRFAGVWQILETLESVSTPNSDLNLPGDMRSDIEALVNSEQMLPIRTRSARKLRNILVHYGLGSAELGILDLSEPLLGLPQHFLNGTDWLAADALLDEQIDTLLRVIGSWTGPFSHTLKDPPRSSTTRRV